MYLVLIGLVIAFILIVLFDRRTMHSCRWRRVGPADEQGQTLYKCAACGAKVLTENGKAPLDCKLNPRK